MVIEKKAKEKTKKEILRMKRSECLIELFRDRNSYVEDKWRNWVSEALKKTCSVCSIFWIPKKASVKGTFQST